MGFGLRGDFGGGLGETGTTSEQQRAFGDQWRGRLIDDLSSLTEVRADVDNLRHDSPEPPILPPDRNAVTDDGKGNVRAGGGPVVAVNGRPAPAPMASVSLIQWAESHPITAGFVALLFVFILGKVAR